VIASFDSRWSIFVAMSLLREGNADLDEYAELVQREEFYGVGTLGEALLGNLVSPSRGLFVYTPVLLFAVAGAVARPRTPGGDGLVSALVRSWGSPGGGRHQ